MITLKLPATEKFVPMTAHAKTCAWYGDSFMPCTCGADPSAVGHTSLFPERKQEKKPA